MDGRTEDRPAEANAAKPPMKIIASLASPAAPVFRLIVAQMLLAVFDRPGRRSKPDRFTTFR